MTTMTRSPQVTRRGRRGQHGFTLIELLVVIAVLAVLATIVLFNVTGVKNKGSAAACATDVGTIQTAVDAYINDTGGSLGTPALSTGDMKATDLGILYSHGYLHSQTTACQTSLTLTANPGSGYDVTGS